MLSYILNELSEALAALGVPTQFGDSALSDHDVPPRIVWVPTSDSSAPAVQLPSLDYRSLETRVAGIDAHIWGASYAQAEAIQHNVRRLFIQKCSRPNVTFGSAKWLSSDNATLGWVCILPVTVAIPVLDAAVDIPSAPPAVPVIDPVTGQPAPDPSAVPPGPTEQVAIVASNPGDHEVAASRGTTTLNP